MLKYFSWLEECASVYETWCTVTLTLLLCAMTWPEGVSNLLMVHAAVGCSLSWTEGYDDVWGDAVSLYDINHTTGTRNGEPIADCFGIIAYETGAIMALADGVNWGDRPKVAARAAVYGFLSHLHRALAVEQGVH